MKASLRLRQSVTEMKSLQREQKKSNLSLLKLSPSKQSPQKQSLKSKFEKFEIEVILQEDFKIGEPSIQKFNIQESVCYSHNYFRRNLNIMNKALCLMCLRSTEKKETYLAVPNNSCRGLLSHLVAKHPEFTQKIALQRKAIKRLRNDKRQAIKENIFRI